MMIADAESSQFPNRLLDAGFGLLLLYVFLPWVLILGFIKLLKFFEREDKKTISNYKKMNYNLNRFISAQERDYLIALSEIKNGSKQSHWIWYIFPQIKGLGFSYQSQFYGITDRQEAEAYLAESTLNARLREITLALLAHKDKTAVQILGHTDALKVKSSMTLFDAVSPNDIYAEVLNTFYNGQRCQKTLKFLETDN